MAVVRGFVIAVRIFVRLDKIHKTVTVLQAGFDAVLKRRVAYFEQGHDV